MTNLTIEQLKFAKSIGATHVDTSENPDGSSGCFYRKDSHAYVRGEWGYGWAGQAILDDASCFAKINFTPLYEHYTEQHNSGEQQTEWDGEGLPPVGMTCEYSLVGGKYKTGTFVGINSRKSIVIEKESGELLAFNDHQINLRPLRTEWEMWVESAHKIANDGAGCAASLLSVAAIYNALKSGSLIAPEVE